MLQEMTIENFAIISKLKVDFDDKMTVLTGETGAGKSIIIDAMGLLVGGRGSTEYIRQGAKKCFVEGLFYLPDTEELLVKLQEFGIADTQDDWRQLIVQREIAQSGKNTCRINGRLVNTSILREIGSFLVDIHGQNEHQALMNAENHLTFLDQFGGDTLRVLIKKYQDSYANFKELERKISQKEKDEQAFAQRMDMLQFQSEEIDSMQLKIGEEEELIEERNKLVNYQKIVSALTESYQRLNENQNGESAVESVAAAASVIEEIAPLDETYSQTSEMISNASVLLQDALAELRGAIDDLEYEEGRLTVIEERINDIRQLKRKYGDSVEKILAYFEKITQELLEKQPLNNSQEELKKKLSALKEETVKLAQKLTIAREKIAKSLEQEIAKQLKALYLEKAVFEVRFFKDRQQLGEFGQDSVEFYLTTNPGEPLKPLVKVASGGELSRIMLAMKTIFSESKNLTSIVFDEVDTGVSGRVAQAIAEKIHEIGKTSQVLCITHLPQVAAIADTQYFIKKEVKDGRTETSLEKLSMPQREQEIARMLAGEEVTKLAVEHARELLRLAHQTTN